MARRLHDAPVDSVSDTRVVETTPLAVTIGNILTVVYVAVISVIGIDTLLEAMDAREGNGFVSAMDTMSAPFLAPFRGVFDNQQFWGTALIAVLVYTAVYLVAMAALRRGRTTVY